MKLLFRFAASFCRNNKGKKLFLPLVFGITALICLALVLKPVAGAVQTAAARSGVELQVTVSEPQQTSAPDFTEELSPESEPAQPETVSLTDFGGYPDKGDLLGRLTISGTAVDCDVYYGDSEDEFHKGAGIYAGSKIPGEGGTVLMGGHTGTYFRDFESVQEGDDITLTTAYGTYHYTVSGMRIATDTDTTAYDLYADTENLIMYTCYPFGILNPTDQRYFIYGDYVSGPVIRTIAESGAEP